MNYASVEEVYRKQNGVMIFRTMVCVLCFGGNLGRVVVLCSLGAYEGMIIDIHKQENDGCKPIKGKTDQYSQSWH